MTFEWLGNKIKLNQTKVCERWEAIPRLTSTDGVQISSFPATPKQIKMLEVSKKKWTPGCSKMFSLTNTITAWIIDSDVLEHPGAHHFDLFWCSSSLSNLASHRLPG